MFIIFQRAASLVWNIFTDLCITRFDVVVTPENVVVKNRRMAYHLIFITLFTMYGVIFLELEATGAVNWSGLWTSDYLYTYQLIPAHIHPQINQLIVLCTISEVLTFMSYIFVQPVKKEFLLVKVDEHSLTKNWLPLPNDITIEILKFREKYKKLLLSIVAIVTILSLIWFYINVYLNGKFVISLHCLLFYWAFQFSLGVVYFYFGNCFCVLNFLKYLVFCL